MLNRLFILLTVVTIVLTTGCAAKKTENMTDEELVKAYCEIEGVELISEVELVEYDEDYEWLGEYYSYTVVDGDGQEIICRTQLSVVERHVNN